jgi:acyl phosphate:glycerol-3-phosphate acyltransferase
VRELALLAAGYLSGSIPFGVLLTRAFTGKDVRAAGSGNIGATNVARVAGKGWGAAVLALDAAKGALPVAAALHVAPEASWLHAAVGLAAFLGHVFPVWLRFDGGKGVATALGVLAVLLPLSAAVGFVTWVVVVALTRVSSLGSLLGAVLAIAAGFFQGRPVAYPSLGVALLLAVLWTHRGNITRLVSRRERRF